MERATRSLDRVLRESEAAGDGKGLAQLPWSRCLEIACGIASGMAYLHSQEPAIIHGDLKPSNVLFCGASLDEPKISDYGLQVALLTAFGAGSVAQQPHVAPELRGAYDAPIRVRAAGDVWSFGWLVYDCTRLGSHFGAAPESPESPESLSYDSITCAIGGSSSLAASAVSAPIMLRRASTGSRLGVVALPERGDDGMIPLSVFIKRQARVCCTCATPLLPARPTADPVTLLVAVATLALVMCRPCERWADALADALARMRAGADAGSAAAAGAAAPSAGRARARAPADARRDPIVLRSRASGAPTAQLNRSRSTEAAQPHGLLRVERLGMDSQALLRMLTSRVLGLPAARPASHA